MHPKMYAELYEAISSFVQEHAGSDNWPDFYCPDDIERDMTDAAAATFDMAVKASVFAQRQSET